MGGSYYGDRGESSSRLFSLFPSDPIQRLVDAGSGFAPDPMSVTSGLTASLPLVGRAF
jgi:hypothetical protein